MAIQAAFRDFIANKAFSTFQMCATVSLDLFDFGIKTLTETFSQVIKTNTEWDA